MNKPILAFYMGYSQPFNGKNYHQQNVFGSEINAIKLAESLTDIYDIYIFTNIPDSQEITYNNVTYLHLFKINNFISFDILIIVRYINYFLYFNHKSTKTFLWVCDTIINPYYEGLRITNNAANLIYNTQDKINKYIFLSDWHISNSMQLISFNNSQYTTIYNPLDLSYYKPNIPIISNRFIYMSDPSRGLSILLDCLIYIQQSIPTISLTVFRSHEFTNIIQEKLKLLNNTVIYGKESQQVIAYECLQAEYFFYPTDFYETFCNCAAEAQLYHTICIYNPIGGLTTTIDDRGLVIPYNLEQPDYTQKTSELVIQLMNNPLQKKIYLEKGYEWAKQLNINTIKHKWLDLFNS